MNKVRRYVVAWHVKRGGSEWPNAMTLEAENVKDARDVFEKSYWTSPHKPYPFHVTVKRFDGLLRCPLCGSWLDEINDANIGYACQNDVRCGVKIRRKVVCV